ncbi:TPA: hypothetical protein ACF6WP_002785, partial [Klebsiella quasipneumoniae subsp. similipneumoniae]
AESIPARAVKQVSKFKHKIMASPLVLVRMKQYPFVSLSKIIINGCARHEIACAAYSKSIEILFSRNLNSRGLLQDAVC